MSTSVVRFMLALAALLLLAAPAQAMPVTLSLDDCDGTMGCEGVSLFASAEDNGDGTISILFQIDTAGFNELHNHFGFNQVALKMVDGWTSVDLVSAPGPVANDENGWLDPAKEAVVSSLALCEKGPSSGKFCTYGFSSFNTGDVLEWEFLVTGGTIRDTDDWSFMAQFASSAERTEGHIISAHSEPVPEPTAALCYAAGLAVISFAHRRRR